MIKVGVLTVSDKSAAGEREDESGAAIREIAPEFGGKVEVYRIVPDEIDKITEALATMADDDDMDVILTTGGTGVAQRDVTPEATEYVIEKAVPGIGETLRAKSLKITPWAMLSRMTAGVRGETLIINLPGSPKGVRECLEWLQDVIPHAVELIKGETGEHQRHESHG